MLVTSTLELHCAKKIAHVRNSVDGMPQAATSKKTCNFLPKDIAHPCCSSSLLYRPLSLPILHLYIYRIWNIVWWIVFWNGRVRPGHFRMTDLLFRIHRLVIFYWKIFLSCCVVVVVVASLLLLVMCATKASRWRKDETLAKNFDRGAKAGAEYWPWLTGTQRECERALWKEKELECSRNCT